MSRFLSSRHETLKPYVPGEQPKITGLCKLNTNESPYPPSPDVAKAASDAAMMCNLYSDPECTQLREDAARVYNVAPECILPVNGSDEILSFAFLAFCDERTGIAYPDITYGFYSVLSGLYHIPSTEIPLDNTFNINVSDYEGLHKNIAIPNPNAPTGIILPLSDIERIVSSNPDNVVIIDEAYIDFGGESAVELIKRYDNLLVTRTFSKSHSLAGARLGLGIGCPEIIRELNTIKYSINPYNVNRCTAAIGSAALRNSEYYMNNCAEIMKTREFTVKELTRLGFELTDSMANFIFARHDKISGLTLYKKLRERGILVRHFDSERIKEYNRITIGSMGDMMRLVAAAGEILGTA